MLYASFSQSLNSIKHNKLRFLFISLNDFFTFIMFGAAYSFFFVQIFPMLESISKLTGLKVLQSLEAQTDDKIMEVAAGILDFTKLYDEIIKLIILFAMTLLIIWIIFQSTSWYNSQKIADKIAYTTKSKISLTAKIKAFAAYFIKFAIISVIAFILLTTLIYLAFKALFVITFTQATIKPEFTPYLVPLIIIIILYLTTAAYTQINGLVPDIALKKDNLKHFRSIIKNSINLNTLMIFLISLAFISIFALLITLFVKFLGIAAGASMLVVTPIILLEFPVIAFARIWLQIETK